MVQASAESNLQSIGRHSPGRTNIFMIASLNMWYRRSSTVLHLLGCLSHFPQHLRLPEKLLEGSTQRFNGKDRTRTNQNIS